jgi:hypothetical protein
MIYPWLSSTIRMPHRVMPHIIILMMRSGHVFLFQIQARMKNRRVATMLNMLECTRIIDGVKLFTAFARLIYCKMVQNARLEDKLLCFAQPQLDYWRLSSLQTYHPTPSVLYDFLVFVVPVLFAQILDCGLPGYENHQLCVVRAVAAATEECFGFRILNCV